MTSQIDDTVIIDGEDAISCNGPVIAKNHPCIYTLADDEENPLANFSACWRAFQAEWEVRNNRLYLNKIIGKYKVLSEEPIFADWFTGTLRANKGKILAYGPNKEWFIYEFDIKIAIEEGLVLENHVTDNRNKDLNELILRYSQTRFPPMLIKCPACSNDVSTSAISCPNCGHPLAAGSNEKSSKKSFHSAGWISLSSFILGLVTPAFLTPFFVLVSLIFAIKELSDGGKVFGSIVLILALYQGWLVMDHFGGLSDSLSVPSESASSIESDPLTKMTGPQRNAVKSAQSYLKIGGFSREGLIEQLASPSGSGYSLSDATYAVDSLNVDWNQEAVESANSYLKVSGFSCQGLVEQLSSSSGSKFTQSQATYGAQKAGAC